jgi:hypothetical protein
MQSVVAERIAATQLADRSWANASRNMDHNTIVMCNVDIGNESSYEHMVGRTKSYSLSELFIFASR